MASVLKQSWNSRSNKWVLFEPGKKGNIIGMRPSKFPGIEVEKDKPADTEKTDNDHDEYDKTEAAEIEDPDKKPGVEDSSTDPDWLF